MAIDASIKSNYPTQFYAWMISGSGQVQLLQLWRWSIYVHSNLVRFFISVYIPRSYVCLRMLLLFHPILHLSILGITIWTTSVKPLAIVHLCSSSITAYYNLYVNRLWTNTSLLSSPLAIAGQRCSLGWRAGYKAHGRSWTWSRRRRSRPPAPEGGSDVGDVGDTIWF